VARSVLPYGLLASVVWAAPAPAAYVPLVARAFRIPLRSPRSDGVAITFDDGPHPQGTPAVLDVLQRAKATATFFLVGEQVERFPALAAEIAAAGHEIAIHGYRHRLLLRRSPRALAADFDRAAAVIGEATGRTLSSYRPPYGIFSGPALAIVRRRGWTPCLWSKWGWDWSSNATAESISARATTGLAAGDIVLLHDADHYSSPGSWRNTAAALPRVLDAVAAIGAGCVSVSQST
jgi:peptidoglycan/xylan/chitin deacetylase (PgdA/CDA1 family)